MAEALRQAARDGDLPQLRALLESGVEVDSRDAVGCTTLHWATNNGHGHTACLKALLAAGASVHSVNRRGWTPLHYASQYGNAASVRALIAAGANVNIQDGYTTDSPFSLALSFRYRRALKILLRAGADVHTGPLASNSRNNDTNAWALVDAIQKVGGWPNYAHRRREIFASVVQKAITHDALPEAINLEIATFIEPPGGY